MSSSRLIEKLQSLLEAKQAEVFDFAEFLASRNQTEQSEEPTIAKSPLAYVMQIFFQEPGFSPFSIF